MGDAVLSVGASQLRRDVKMLECVLRRAAKPGKGLEGLSSEERLRIRFFSLVWREGG